MILSPSPSPSLPLFHSATGNAFGPILLLYLVDTRYETASNYVDYIKYSIIFSWHSMAWQSMALFFMSIHQTKCKLLSISHRVGKVCNM